MPEKPEVLTVVKSLKPRIVGKKIIKADVYWDDIIEAIYLANGKEVPKEYKNREKSSITKKGKSVISKIKSKLDDVKSRKIIQQYGFEERLNMTEDNILEIYSYEDLKKFKTAIDRGEKLDKPKTPKESKIKELPGKIKTTVSKAAAAGKQKLGKAIVNLSEKRIRRDRKSVV